MGLGSSYEYSKSNTVNTVFLAWWLRITGVPGRCWFLTLQNRMFYLPQDTNLLVSVGLNLSVHMWKSLICFPRRTGLRVVSISLMSKMRMTCLLYWSNPTVARCFLWLNLSCWTFSYGHWKLLMHLLSIQIRALGLGPSWTVTIQFSWLSMAAM